MASHRALRLQQLLVFSVAAVLASCGGEPAKVQAARRLTDDFSPRLISGSARTTPQPPLAEWRFSEPAAGQAWEPFSGVQGFEVSGGLLKGEATNKVPLIAGVCHADAPAWADRLEGALREQLQVAEVFQGEVGPVVGANVGPGVVGLAVFQPREAEAALIAPL